MPQRAERPTLERIQTRAVLTLDPARPFVAEATLLVHEGRLAQVLAAGDPLPAGWERARPRDLSGCLAIPAFVQTHLHLCQTLFRGLADDLHLLDWLRQRIFPLEAAHTSESLRASVRLGLLDLVRSGTVTLMDMGTVRHTEVIAEELEASGMRAFFGKALMDTNPTCPSLREPPAQALEEARALATRWHGAAAGRLRCAITPRFVLSCSDGLLSDSHALAGELPHARWHTHASESRFELEAVRERCGCDNVEHLDRLRTLSDLSCLAHCIHLNPGELAILERTGAHVLHCPGSNLKLASGICDVPGLRARGIQVSLGCDGAACNNTLDMFHEMRLAALIQKPAHGPTAMPAGEALALATREGALALGWEQETGSLAAGRSADVVFLDLERAWNPVSPATQGEFEGAVVYSGSPENVRAVLALGEWLVWEGKSTRFDEAEVRARASSELKALRARAGV